MTEEITEPGPSGSTVTWHYEYRNGERWHVGVMEYPDGCRISYEGMAPEAQPLQPYRHQWVGWPLVIVGALFILIGILAR